MYLIVGNFRTNYIVERRLLSSTNPAGSSRMLRLAEAIDNCGQDVAILSSGSSMVLGYNRKIYDPSFDFRHNRVKVFVASAITIPYLSAIWEIFSLTFLFFKLKNRNQIKAIIMYCYYPSTTLLGFYAKFLGVTVIEDLEDVVNPIEINLFQSSLMDYLRQKIGYYLMRIALFLADIVIIPNSIFSKYIPLNKNILHISGCFDFNDSLMPKFPNSNKLKLTILISGLLNKEQGFDLFLKSLEHLNLKDISFSRYKFLICGYGFDQIELLKKIEQYDNLDVEFYGFVDLLKYKELLNESNVCVALQNPYGIYGQLKIPSKAFEYMSYGKMLIVSDVGDFSCLPPETVLLLESYSARSLSDIIENLTFEMAETYGYNAFIYAKDNWSFFKVGSQIINAVNFSKL